MRLNEISYGTSVPINGYGPGFFRIGANVVKGSVLLTPHELCAWGGFGDAQTILARAAMLDVVLLGTGEALSHIPDALRRQLEDADLGVELMATPTACRTYNVLLSEGRRIGAALLAI